MGLTYSPERRRYGGAISRRTSATMPDRQGLERIDHMATPRLKWGSVEGLEAAINRYFAECTASTYPPDVPGFCLAVRITKETYSYYASGRYMRHTPSYIADHLPDDEVITDEPSTEDLAAVDTFDWPIKMEISGDGGRPKEWSEDQRLRRAVGEIIKRASLVIEAAWHREAVDLGRKGKSPIMPLFALKASHGYREDAPQLAAPDSAPAEDRFQLTITGSIPLLLDAAPAAKSDSVSSDSGEH